MEKISVFNKISLIKILKYLYIVIILVFIGLLILLFFFLKTNVYSSIYSNKQKDLIIDDASTKETNSLQFNKLESNIIKIEKNFNAKKNIEPMTNFKDVFNN
ncbi:MAG TPA: hypothetical protein PLD95_03040 [bacterium]|jgi:uncharacterized membrane protein|nr:hypothetical protein [bacterium]HOG38423.1 hypothetical protein [bacterium]HQI03316.1 hypothetical protein [bacterium]